MIITSTTPAQGSVNINTNTSIYIDFDLDINPDSVDQSSVVMTSKDLVLSKKSLERTDLYIKDDFFNDKRSAIITGVVSIDSLNPKRLIFKPNVSLIPNKKYDILVSQAIAGIDDSLLGKIKKLSFTTAASDVLVDELPEVTETITTILGNYVNIDSSTLSVVSVTPKDGSINNSSLTIKLIFNSDISEVVFDDCITVTSENIINDEPGNELAFTSTANSKTLTITLDEEYDENSLLTVSINGVENMSSYSMSFMSRLNPYYSSIKLMRLKAGTVLKSLTDAQLASLMMLTSREADMVLAKMVNSTNYSRLRENYCTMNALKSALLNNHDFNLADSITKTLGDFSIRVDTKSKISLYNSLLDEIDDYNTRLESLLMGQTFSTPVRSSNHPNYRLSGREFAVRPMINTKARYYDRLYGTWDELL